MSDWHTTMLTQHLVMIEKIEKQREVWQETFDNYDNDDVSGWLPQWFRDDGKTLCKQMVKGYNIQIKAAKAYIGQCDNHKGEPDPTQRD